MSSNVSAGKFTSPVTQHKKCWQYHLLYIKEADEEVKEEEELYLLPSYKFLWDKTSYQVKINRETKYGYKILKLWDIHKQVDMQIYEDDMLAVWNTTMSVRAGSNESETERTLVS